MSNRDITVCIIGTGLIGGSLALALRHAGYTNNIIGAGRTESTLNRALELGVIDRWTTDLAEAASQSDVIVVCVPLGAMRTVFEQITSVIPDTCVITDAGSTKQSVIEDAKAVLGSHFERFVPGHPIAGTENSGVEAAFRELYQNRRVILTPDPSTSNGSIEQVKQMWEAAGAVVECMDAAHHDLVLAGTSHLPHLLAFGLVDCLNNLDEVDEIFRFAAGGFRDFTRIASSDPVMWRDVCLNNREQLMLMMKRYFSEMDKMYHALENSDGEELMAIFDRAKQARDTFCD